MLVIVWGYEAELTIGVTAEFDEDLDVFRYFVLMKEKMYFLDLDGDVELYGEKLRVGAVEAALPAFGAVG